MIVLLRWVLIVSSIMVAFAGAYFAAFYGMGSEVDFGYGRGAGKMRALLFIFNWVPFLVPSALGLFAAEMLSPLKFLSRQVLGNYLIGIAILSPLPDIWKIVQNFEMYFAMDTQTLYTIFTFSKVILMSALCVFAAYGLKNYGGGDD